MRLLHQFFSTGLPKDFFRLLFLVSLATICSPKNQAQTLPAAPKDPKAVLLANRALQALGAPLLTNAQTVQATGTLTLLGSPDIVFPVVLTSRGTRELRTELTTPTGLRFFIASNGHGIIRQPDGSVRHLSEDNMAIQRVNHIPALSFLSEYTRSDMALDYLGSATVDGAPADVIAVSIYSGQSVVEAQQRQDRTRVVYYIDSKTALITRIEQQNYAENDPNQVEKRQVSLSDYRDVNGVMIPFHQQTSADGKPYLDLVFTSVDFGISVQDSDFSLSE